MGRSIPIRLNNGRAWPKKAAAADHFKDMLGRYRVGAQITDPDDHSDLAALVRVYDLDIEPGGQTKTGAGIKFFEKQKDLDHPGNTSCFHVVRVDGTRIDFSYLRALDSVAKRSTASD